MKCQNPILIKNRYTNKFMYVACGKCDGCRTQLAVQKSASLATDMLNYNSSLFVTLTYDNKHIPFVVNHRSNIYRINSCNKVECIEETEDVFNFSSVYRITNFNISGFDTNDCVAVLYYRDVQLFFKRLRKRLNKDYGKEGKFNFYLCGEYGTFHKRPHYHIIFEFKDRGIATSVAGLLPQYWQMCDWSKSRNNIKFASVGVSSYVSSYVNSAFSCGEISKFKRFKPFTKRSKNLSFGVDFDLFKKVKDVIEREFGKEFPNFMESDFRYLSQKKVDNVSLRLIPKGVFRSLFHKVKGFSNLSFIRFRLLCFNIYGFYRKERDFEKFGIIFDTESDNKAFLRCYYNFLTIFGYDDNFYNFDKYVIFAYRFLVFYDCLVIKDSMLQYLKMSPSDYLVYCYNTFSPSVTRSKRNIILRSLGLSIYYVHKKDFYINKEQNLINQHVKRYKGLLLPKHMNSLINNF